MAPTHRVPILRRWAILAPLLAPAALAAQPAARCTDPGFRRLDFWVGEWEVTDPSGRVVGKSAISPILGGCAVREVWTSDAVRGESLFMFERPTGAWHQMWVDSQGALLRMEGSPGGGGMVFQGSRVGSDGKSRRLRVTVAPGEDGTVRQLQERSEDGGRSWAVIFDGRYRRTG